MKRLLKFINLYFLLIFAICTVSCYAPIGIIETKLNQWGTVKFNLTGVSCDLPIQSLSGANSYYVKESATSRAVAGLGYKKIRIRMHPVWQGSSMAEPFYLIDILLVRLEGDKYEEYKLGKHRIRSYEQFHNDYNVFHSDITKYMMDVHGFQGREQDSLLVVRKDYRAPNGDYFLCGATLYATPGIYPSPREADISAVMRIIDSVNFLQ